MKITLHRIFFIVLFLGLLIMTLRPIADPDFWWHLRTGQLLVQTRSIPHADPFSFTKVGKKWIAHEWLSEVIIYSLFRLGGYDLLIFTFSLIITGAFFLAYIRCTSQWRPYVAGFVLLLGAISTAPTWGVRPQMISLLLFSLFLFLLERFRQDGKIRFLFPLPLIMIIWVNLHAGYFLGIALLGIYVVGGFIEMLLIELHVGEIPINILNLKSLLTLFGCLCVCAVASLINPNGFHILIYPFQTLTSHAMHKFIQEWFSTDFHQLMWQPFAFFLLGLIAVGMLAKKSIKPTNILLVFISGYAALFSMRSIPLFIVTAIPVFAEQLGSLVKIAPSTKPLPRLPQLAGCLLLVCTIIFTGLCFVQTLRQQNSIENDNFPKAATDWLLGEKTQGKLFNSYGWGGYIIWRMYPDVRVYIDGRADVYGDEFIFEYLSIYRAEPGWEDKLKNRAIQMVLIESSSQLANMLRRTPPWRIVYEDKLSILFENVTTRTIY